jgi:predicted glycogen debranching enzyme
MSEKLSTPTRRIAWPPSDAVGSDALATREWLVTNGLGGYASGTIAGMITRRYHGYLIAALPAPLGRMVMLSHIAVQVRYPDGRRVEVGGREQQQPSGPPDTGYLVEFRLEGGLPVWRYDINGMILETRLFLTHMQNTVRVMYELLDGATDAELGLRPSVNFRAQEAPVSEPLGWPYEFRAINDHYEIALKDSPLPSLRLMLQAGDVTFTLKGKRTDSILYPVEEHRGYQARGTLWSPGYYRLRLKKGERATLVASTEPFKSLEVLAPDESLAAEQERRKRLIARAVPSARRGLPAELVLAADQFIITPAGRTEEAARARASGDEVRTVIAGYHWFTDWGRDTMISLEGLTLTTGRETEAGYILRTFAHYVRDGLIPNMFPEGEKEGLYHTADATLWFFHAVERYRRVTKDQHTLATLFPTFKKIVAAHVHGTKFGIHVDSRDGLLCQGAPGYQLTWMDAKVDDWVVTPRRGKAVEINALWYNALCLMEQWAGQMDDRDRREYGDRAAAVRKSFNERFWYAAGGYLYDVVDSEQGGNNSKCRPNQLLAISLDHPVLERDKWEKVIRTVQQKLLTPVGLRTLAPDDSDFKPRYYGDLRTRDAAYHQGTVWGWLAGPYVDAWLKVYPDDVAGVRRALDGFAAHLDEACIGSVSEIFDAEPPFTARGCIAQAWSVAELLRCWVKLSRYERDRAGTQLATHAAGGVHGG